MTMMLKLLSSLLKAHVLSTITMPSPHKTSPISTLPTEILIQILKNLNLEDLRSCVLVSHHWYECAVERLWYNLYFRYYDSDTINRGSSFCAQNQTFTHFRFIRQLKLHMYISDDIFSTFSRCENLEKLNLSRCVYLTEEGLAKVLQHFANLVAIDLSWVANTTNESVISLAKIATRLQNVNLRGCTKVTDDAVLALAASCPLLRRLDLYGLILLTDNAISSLALSCPMLVKLNLNLCKLITDASVRMIWQHLIHIRELRLSRCSLLTDAAFPAPPRLDVQLDASKPFPTSSATENHDLYLLILDVSGCSLISDDAIEGVISHAPKIHLIYLWGCVRVKRVHRETQNSICFRLY